MTVYENAIKASEEYLSELCSLDTAEHIPEDSYRVVFNNWEGRCESTIRIDIDSTAKRLIYKMYYNCVVATEEQKMTLLEYFSRADKSTIRERCTGGIEDNGAVYLKVEHSCLMYGLTCEDLKAMERVCTERIYDDRAAIKRYLRG